MAWLLPLTIGLRYGATLLLLGLVYQGSTVALVIVLGLLCVAAEAQAMLYRRLLYAIEAAEAWRVRAVQAIANQRDQP